MAVKQKKSKTNRIKRSNKRHTKLAKQGKLKHRRNKNVLPKLQLPIKSTSTVEEEEEEEDNDNVLHMVEPEDLEFLKRAVADRSYSIYNNVLHTNNQAKRKHKGSDTTENIEDIYENEILPASISKKRTRYLLPIKTALGLEKRIVEEDIEEEGEEGGIEQCVVKSEEDKSSNDEFEIGEVGKDSFSRPMSTAEILALREQTLAHYKFQIGVLSSSLLEDPQLKVKNIAVLLDLMKNCQHELQFTVRKLIIVSLTEIFKDIVPGYQIKHQDDSAVKLKKETRILQNFEKSFLKGYRIFLTRLERYASILYRKKGDTRKRTEQSVSLGEVAVRCLCELLVNQPYFNYSPNIVQLIIPYLDNSSPNIRKMVADYVMQVIKGDKRGEISLDIVRRVNHVIKSRSHCVHSELISVLLVLPIKDINLDQEKENELKQKQLTNKQKFLMSKKERKRNKRLQEVERELLETKAEENKQKKQHNLTEVMKIVFTIYFRILKKAPTSKVLSCALAGLAKFAHCINIDFYQDLVNVIDSLMVKGTLNCRQQLHCIETVFKILSGQGQFLNIDPLRFYTHLYRNILYVHVGKSHEDAEIVLRILDNVLVQRHKRITQHRLLAFAKRLATLATQTAHNGTLGCLGVLKRVMQVGNSVDILLDVDSSLGQGIYDPFLEEPEHCNASSTALWEITALSRHYHQAVKSVTQYIAAGAQSGNNVSLSPELAKLSALELFKEYDPSDVVFKPAVLAPQPFNTQSKVSASYSFRDSWLASLEKQMSPDMSADFSLLFQKR